MHRSSLVATKKTGRVDETPDDRRDIFEPLTRYGSIDTKHFERYGSRHYTTTRERLQKYFHETADWPLKEKAIIRNVSAHAKSFNEPIYYHRGPAIWSSLNCDEQTKSLLESTIIGPRFDEHDRALCRAVIEIETSAKKAGLEFYSHLDIVRKSKRLGEDRPLHIPVPGINHIFSKGGYKELTNIALRPDALFGIRYPEGVRFFAVEMDRGNETFIPSHGFNQTSWLEKILSYRAAKWHDLGISKIHILAITTTEKTAQNLVEKFNEPNLYALPVSSTIHPTDYYFNATWKGVNALKLSQP